MIVSLVAAAALVVAAPAPVTEVTVHGDVARVTRTVSTTVAGQAMVEIVVPTAGVREGSVRLETDNPATEVESFLLRPIEVLATRDHPRRLATGLAPIDDEIAEVERQRAVVAHVAEAARGQDATKQTDGGATAAPLDPRGWQAMQATLAAFETGLHARMAAFEAHLETLRKRRNQVAEAAKLALARESRGGLRVLATLRGHGTARLRLSYLVDGVRWRPSYDVRLDPRRDQVTISLAGLVGQRTGEDWTDVRLALSTALPASLVTLPALDAWRIGARDRFIPMSRAVAHADDRHEAKPPAASPRQGAESQAYYASPCLIGTVFDQTGMPIKGVKLTARSSRRNNTLVSYSDGEGAFGFGGMAVGSYEVVASAPKLGSVIVKGNTVRPGPCVEVQILMEVETAQEEVKVVERAPIVNTTSASVKDGGDLARPGAASWARSGAHRPSLGLLPPEPPATSLPPDSPARLAGGQDLVFVAPAPETLREQDGERLVPLARFAWPARLERVLYPAIEPHAYLIANVRNPGATALIAGDARLFAGADPVGHARLPLVPSGESFTVPLGIDRTMQAVRRVTVATKETGFFTKDEVSRYDVAIEITNPHPRGVQVTINDQVPISPDKTVGVQLVASAPAATVGEAGALSWRMTIPAATTTTVRFAYALRRPRGHELRSR